MAGLINAAFGQFNLGPTAPLTKVQTDSDALKHGIEVATLPGAVSRQIGLLEFRL